MKERVVILLTDDDRGYWSIYDESGGAIEHDFESYEEAEEWATGCGYEVVESFNF